MQSWLKGQSHILGGVVECQNYSLLCAAKLHLRTDIVIEIIFLITLTCDGCN